MAGRLWITRLIFALSGIGISAWALLIPAAKIRFHLADGRLGQVLFLANIGGVFVMFLAGPMVARWGSRTCVIASLLLICLLLPLLGWAPTVPLFTLLLCLYSANFGVLDVSLNIQGALVEAQSARLQMSGFHACFSLGTLAMALVASLLFKTGLRLEWLCGLCVMIILAGLSQSLKLPSKCYDPTPTGRHFAIPGRHALILGLSCFAVFMCEGAAIDWSTIFLHFSRHMPPGDAVLGYAAFTVATALARMTGDPLATRLGQTSLMRLGVVMAVVGFALVALVPSGVVGVIGFGLVGFGSGNIIPLVFSAAARVPGMEAHHAMQIVVGIGYVGFLAGPVMIGLLASHFGLNTAFIVDAILLGLTFPVANYVGPAPGYPADKGVG